MKLASVVIPNYNYARFLTDAIESALGQTYRNTEVVVVDDGSTDDSRQVIDRYRGKVTAILKENGGQASAFNAGLVASRGEVVLFLDSDDILLPTALERAMRYFDTPDVVKVHWPMWWADAHGTSTGRMFPGTLLAEGDLTVQVCRVGPTSNLSAPTSGNAWTRPFLEQLLPMPEELYRTCADTLLFEAAPFFGRIAFVREPQTLYRVHGDNTSLAVCDTRAKVDRELRFYEHYTPILFERCCSLGLQPDLEEWKRNSWWHRHAAALDDLERLPAGDLILVDDGCWEIGPIGARTPMRLVERAGVDWGPPADDAQAIAELDRQVQSGARFLVFGWPAFWWLEHYHGFREHLDRRYDCILRNNRVIVYVLEKATPPLRSPCD